MAERKPWTEKEDQTLKELREVRKIAKWSQISHIMKEEFQIYGRNGKQCRERYHNHLDSRICKQKWKPEQEKKLLSLHNSWGNRWAAISRQLPGRTDNCVKNHFYSYFRKCLKTANTLISKHGEKKIRPLKLGIINKIVSIIQAYHKDTQNFDKNLYTEARQIKNIILSFEEQNQQSVQNCAQALQELSKKLSEFNRVSRKKIAKKKKVKVMSDESEQLYPKNSINEFEQQVQEQQVKKEQIKNEPLPCFQGIKLYPLGQTPQIKYEQNRMNNQKQKNNNELNIVAGIQQTPIKQRRSQKQKNSSYCAINSVDYLDVKQCPPQDARDFIFMDQDKQWKLFFQ